MRLAMNRVSIKTLSLLSLRLAVARGPLRMRPIEQTYAFWRPDTGMEPEEQPFHSRGYFCESNFLGP
jgi:hypothetical protein